MMQSTNNFDTIISTWRRMSGEHSESVTVSMSGDSPDYQIIKKKEEESNLLPEKVKGPLATAASAGTVVTIAEVPSEHTVSGIEDKLINHDKDENKEAAGDSSNNKNSEYLEIHNMDTKSPDGKYDKSPDTVDSVYISPSSPIKPPQSTTSTPEDEDCMIKCLYYTLQCCDCVLM